jgi:hypothetical protein
VNDGNIPSKAFFDWFTDAGIAGLVMGSQLNTNVHCPLCPDGPETVAKQRPPFSVRGAQYTCPTLHPEKVYWISQKIIRHFKVSKLNPKVTNRPPQTSIVFEVTNEY